MAKNVNTSSLCSTGLFFSIQSEFADFYTQIRLELLNFFYDLHSSVFQYVLSPTAKNKFGACFEHRVTQSSQSAFIITSFYGKLNMQRM